MCARRHAELIVWRLRLKGKKMLQWKNPRFLGVLVVLMSLAASFGSWGWHSYSWLG